MSHVLFVSPAGKTYSPAQFVISEAFRCQQVSLPKEKKMTFQNVPSIRATHLVSADLSSNSVSTLFEAISAKLGNPDLESALDVIERIYQAPAEAHWPAAEELAKAARDISDDHEI